MVRASRIKCRQPCAFSHEHVDQPTLTPAIIASQGVAEAECRQVANAGPLTVYPSDRWPSHLMNRVDRKPMIVVTRPDGAYSSRSPRWRK